MVFKSSHIVLPCDGLATSMPPVVAQSEMRPNVDEHNGTSMDGYTRPFATESHFKFASPLHTGCQTCVLSAAGG